MLAGEEQQTAGEQATIAANQANPTDYNQAKAHVYAAASSLTSSVSQLTFETSKMVAAKLMAATKQYAPAPVADTLEQSVARAIEAGNAAIEKARSLRSNPSVENVKGMLPEPAAGVVDQVAYVAGEAKGRAVVLIADTRHKLESNTQQLQEQMKSIMAQIQERVNSLTEEVKNNETVKSAKDRVDETMIGVMENASKRATEVANRINATVDYVRSQQGDQMVFVLKPKIAEDEAPTQE